MPTLKENPNGPMQWVNKMLSHLDSGSSLLDLGCGTGDPADIEIAKMHQVTGVDISIKQLAIAREKSSPGLLYPCGFRNNFISTGFF